MRIRLRIGMYKDGNEYRRSWTVDTENPYCFEDLDQILKDLKFYISTDVQARLHLSLQEDNDEFRKHFGVDMNEPLAESKLDEVIDNISVVVQHAINKGLERASLRQLQEDRDG